MARARGLFILLTAARAASAHAWEYAAPPATSFFAHAASSGAPAAAAARGLCTHAAASGAPAAAARGLCTRAAAASRAYSTHAAASAATSRGHIGSALAPVGVVGSGGRGIPTRQLAYGVLAAYVMLTCAPITEWDLVDEDMQALYSEYIDPRSRMVMPMPKGRRPPSAQEVRANTEMLKRISRQMNELMKVQKEGSREMQKEHADSYWNLLEDFVNKAKSVLSMVSTAKEFYALVSSTLLGSILLYNNHGDPVQYFVCPFSDYSEVVGIFLFTVTPKDGTQQADGSSGCSENSKGPIHFSTCEVYGKTFGIFLSFHKETGFFALTEDELPCIFGPIVKQRWSYVCAKQLVESLIFGKDNDPEFSWIGPRMDFIPGVCVPRVFACFDNVCDNFVGMHSLEDPVSAQQYCGEYARSMLDMTLTSKPLGWNPLRTLKCLLDKVLTYQHKTYKDSVTSQALASS